MQSGIQQAVSKGVSSQSVNRQIAVNLLQVKQNEEKLLDRKHPDRSSRKVSVKKEHTGSIQAADKQQKAAGRQLKGSRQAVNSQKTVRKQAAHM